MENRIFDFIKNNFPKKIGLFAGFIFLFIFIVVPTDSFFEKIIPTVSYRFLSYTPLVIIWLGFWLYLRNHLPKNKKGYVGVVICIRTENDKQKNRLKNDFVRKMQDLLFEKKLADKINIILLNNYQVEYALDPMIEYSRNKQGKKENKKWERIKKKIDGHFFVFGEIKERLNLENTYYIDLNALVLHAPVNLNIEKQMVQDFLSIWWKQITFHEKLEVKGFSFAADSVFVAVEYIVGIAAFVSGNISLALDLHAKLDVDPYFTRFDKLPSNLQKVKAKLRILLAEENYIVARILYEQGMFEDSEKHLNKSISFYPNYGPFLLKSILEFVYRDNINESLNYIYKAQDYAGNDGTWKQNEAFLFMYMGHFDKALKAYKEFLRMPFYEEDRGLLQVYKFNEDILKRNPEKIQCLFIIGYLKYKKQENYPEALEYFENFMDKSGSQDRFRLLRKKAEIYITDIKQKMNLK